MVFDVLIMLIFRPVRWRFVGFDRAHVGRITSLTTCSRLSVERVSVARTARACTSRFKIYRPWAWETVLPCFYERRKMRTKEFQSPNIDQKNLVQRLAQILYDSNIARHRSPTIIEEHTESKNCRKNVTNPMPNEKLHFLNNVSLFLRNLGKFSLPILKYYYCSHFT